MRVSKYVVFSKSEKRDKFNVFNLLNNAIMEIDKSTKRILENASDNNINTLLPQEDIDMLKSTGFLIEDDCDEISLARYMRERLIYNPTRVFLTLIFTYSCNLACKYCYQSGIRDQDPTIMSDKQTIDVFRFVKRFLETRAPKFVDVNFFGGEPLLSLSDIELITTKLNQLSCTMGFKTNYLMCTNGVLLTEQTADRLKKWKINQIQISFDGPEKEHNLRRIFRDGSGSFKKTLRGLLNSLNRGFETIINIGVDLYNKDVIPQFLDFLDTELTPEQKLHVIIGFGPITSTVTPGLKYSSRFEVPDYKQLTILIEPYKEAKHRGFRIASSFGRTICHFQSDNSLIIDPSGGIYKCFTGTGLKEFYVSSIHDEFHKFASKWAQFTGEQTWNNKKCLSCKFFPICGGGCRYQSLVDKKNSRLISCPSDKLEPAIEKLLPILTDMID